MGGQGQTALDVLRLVDRDVGLLVAQRHAFTEVRHVHMGAFLHEQCPPDVELVTAERLVLASGLGDGKREVQIRVLQLIVLLAGRASATSLRIAGLAMQLLGQGEGQCQSAPSGRSGQQQGMGQAACFRMSGQPAGQSFLADGHAFRSHASKIAAITRQVANASRP